MKKLIYTLVIIFIFSSVYMKSQDKDLIWQKSMNLTTSPTIAKLSNDEKYLVLGYNNGFNKLSIYDLNKKAFISTDLVPNITRVSQTSINFNSKNELVGYGYVNGVRSFFNYDIENSKFNKITPYDTTIKSYTTFLISPAAKYIYSYVSDSLLAIWSGETHELLNSFNKNNGMIARSLYFSNDDSKEIFYQDSTIFVLDIAKRDTLAKFPYKSYLIPYALRITDDNNIILADKYDMYIRKYDFKGKQVNFLSAPFTLDNFEISRDADKILQIYQGYGIIFNSYQGQEKSFIYPAVTPKVIAKPNLTKNEYLIISGESFIKLITLDTIVKAKIDLNNFTDIRYYDNNNLFGLQTGGSIIKIDATSGANDEKNRYELSNLKFVPNNNKKATENYMQRAIRVYDLMDLNGNIDSLRGYINISNYNFSQDMTFLHISGTTSNYIYNFIEKKQLWDKDSANIVWSGWKNYIIKSMNVDSVNSKLVLYKVPENTKVTEIIKLKSAKYMLTNSDAYIYVENKGTKLNESKGWIRYNLDDTGSSTNFDYSDTLYGGRSKSLMIRNDNHVFIYSTTAIRPEIWIRDINDGKIIYYNKCVNSLASIRAVAFTNNYKQFTLAFSDGSLATYKIPEGILDVENEKITNNFTISPNPASNYISVSHAGLDPASIEIFNIFGEKTTPSAFQAATQQGKPSQEGNFKIDISDLAPGVYFIKIGDRFEKFVKM